ncbi:MAG: GNAT family N-acetyltransferase [Hyphomicrobiales bacterium]
MFFTRHNPRDLKMTCSTQSMMTVEVLTGDLFDNVMDDVEQLRLGGYRDWPYLYVDASKYNQKYFEAFRGNKNAIVLGAFDGSWLVGVSTGAPLADVDSGLADAFQNSQLDLSDVFYCGESILLRRYRKKGVGKQFFFLRELHARELGFKHICFCTVVRNTGHPLMPAKYVSLDEFWRARGYEPLNGVIARSSWRDIGQASETQKTLQFWMKDL